MKTTIYTKEHLNYLKRLKLKTLLIHGIRLAVLFAIILLWELFARFEIIDPFISSSPSRIFKTTGKLFKSGIIDDIAVTLYETTAGFLLSTVIGTIIALLLWWSETLRRVAEPYIVVLNSLPKIALGPVIIAWFGIGPSSIIFMAFLIGIIVAVLTMLTGFLATDENKILLLKSMGAKKYQILLKLVIPGSLPTFVSMLKLNVGMAWIGSIMGEYISSDRGLGYQIVYGGQVLNLDLVMSATVILCALAGIMYALVALAEKLIKLKK